MKTTIPKPPPPVKVPLVVAENAEAKSEFVRVVPLLGEKLDERDRSLLVDYALTHARIIELRGLVDIEGYTLEGAKGGLYTNPLVNIMTSQQNHLAQLRRDLYFTPRSRIEKQNKAVLSKSRSIRDSLKDDES